MSKLESLLNVICEILHFTVYDIWLKVCKCSPGLRVTGNVVLGLKLLHRQVVGEPTVKFLQENMKVYFKFDPF